MFSISYKFHQVGSRNVNRIASTGLYTYGGISSIPQHLNRSLTTSIVKQESDCKNRKFPWKSFMLATIGGGVFLHKTFIHKSTLFCKEVGNTNESKVYCIAS